MYNQTENISDYIFPLIRATKTNGIYKYGELIGTGFFIASGGYALTAAHVIDQLTSNQPENGVVLALFSKAGMWHPYEMVEYEKHPSQDVGIIKIDGNWWNTFLVLSNEAQHSSGQYNCWGYPAIVAREISRIQEGAIERPELIYTQGYIRRRISRELEMSMYVGNQFYELSEIVGEGNSGGPIINKKSVGKEKWDIIGVYIGEKSGENMNISYAVRAESFANWKPALLETTIIEKSKENVA